METSRVTSEIRQLVADHHQEVYRYAYRLCGERGTAEDLTQQVFLTAHRHWEQLRDPAAARAWLFTILRRAAQRAHRQQPLAPGGTVFESQLEVPLAEVAVATAPESLVDEERLQGAINQLSEEYKQVILLYYFEDCPYKEIAARLEIPLGTVMSRLARAKRQLRQTITSALTAETLRAESGH